MNSGRQEGGYKFLRSQLGRDRWSPSVTAGAFLALIEFQWLRLLLRIPWVNPETEVVREKVNELINALRRNP